jgi:hypothetical protein
MSVEQRVLIYASRDAVDQEGRKRSIPECGSWCGILPYVGRKTAWEYGLCHGQGF